MPKQYSSPPAMVIDQNKDYTATFKTNKGEIVVDLLAADAPVTVNNFFFLAQDDYYNGVIFHRVIPGFMIQGGDPLGTGMGGPDGPRGFAKQAAELGFPFDNEIHPSLKFDVPGRLAMANTGRPKTNGSQFFITEEPTPHLNGLHTIFGDCSGLSIVRRIARVPASSPVTIKKVTVERVGPKPAKAPEG